MQDIRKTQKEAATEVAASLLNFGKTACYLVVVTSESFTFTEV